jgi:hypothetical protein
MAKQKFVHYVPRPKPRKRPGRHKKRLNKHEKRQQKARTKGCCYITMKTNAGELTVYIDSMDGLTDPPMVSAWMFGRKTKTISDKYE